MLLKTFISFYLTFFYVAHLAAQVQWQLIKEKDGIKVYTADNTTSNIKSIKAVGVFDGTCHKLVSIFLDIEKQKEWVYATEQAYLINRIADKELLYYVETSLPWPVKNRDAAIRMKIDQHTSGNTVKISTIASSAAIPVQDGKVRVTDFTGNWEVKAMGKGKIRIEYFLDIDPGGNVPAWITNLFITRGPYETLYNLSELLKN